MPIFRPDEEKKILGTVACSHPPQTAVIFSEQRRVLKIHASERHSGVLLLETHLFACRGCSFARREITILLAPL